MSNKLAPITRQFVRQQQQRDKEMALQHVVGYAKSQATHGNMLYLLKHNPDRAALNVHGLKERIPDHDQERFALALKGALTAHMYDVIEMTDYRFDVECIPTGVRITVMARE